MARLSICLLGHLQVTLDGKPVTRFDSDKVRALPAYLAVEADRPHRREKLAGLLWPDRPERSARTNLRSALGRTGQAREHLSEARRLGSELEAALPLAFALPGFALLWASSWPCRTCGGALCPGIGRPYPATRPGSMIRRPAHRGCGGHAATGGRRLPVGRGI